MIKFEDFFMASNVGMINVETLERINLDTARKYMKEGYVVKVFEPTSDFMIKVWLEKTDI